MDCWGGMGMGWGMGFGWILSLFFWVAVLVAVIALVRWMSDQPRSGDGGGKRALDILQERYARGEIEREEYEQKRRDLGG